jgi:hypothetical protein
MRLLPVLLASVSAMGVAAACSPARADWDDGWRRHEWHEQQERRWREHDWREHEWREHQRQSYYAAPPVIYSVPQPAYPYAPQGYYAVPPAAYYAPPPIYQNPGVSIGFGFGFR